MVTNRIAAYHKLNTKGTKCVCDTQMPPIMDNSKDGQGHKDKYLDTSRKILSQETLMCNMKALIFILKLMKPRKGLITRNTHVKYQSSNPHYSKVISKVKVFKKWVKLQGKGHRVKNSGTNGKVLSQGIFK